nr:MAG TPA: hypothetical protein [Caudoviricetes sp.]
MKIYMKDGSARLYDAIRNHEEQKERTFIISNKKAELFKYFCLGNDIDTISSSHDEKNRYFSCLMTDKEFAEAKSFCDKYCRPEKAKEKCNREVICIIIEETRIVL